MKQSNCVRSALMRRSVWVGLMLASILLSSVVACAEEGLNLEFSAVEARVGEDLKYLASDEIGGRGVGTEGIDAAADYIRDEFKRLGLVSGVDDGSYYQPFPIEGLGTILKDQTAAVLTGADGAETTLSLEIDYQPQLLGGKGPLDAEVVFAGYGITAAEYSYDDYADLDCEGKWVVVIRREPQQNNADSPFDGTETSSYATIRNKMATAAQHGASGLILVNDLPGVESAGGDFLSAPELFGSSTDSIPFIHMTRASFEKLLAAAPLKSSEGNELKTLAEIEAAIDANLEPINGALGGVKLRYQVGVDTVMAKNVIGVLEGEGPLADETIVIGAHYDHLGMGGYGSRTPDRAEIHNGADDNATGTAAIMELARRFAQADKKPARRMIFIAFSGEERGLIGSTYFVANPTLPLEKIVAMVNFDMIGWLRNDALTIYGAASGVNFSELISASGTDAGLDLKPIDGGFAGSDHLPFISKQIPALFLHTGLHDVYHTPDDDYDSINVEGAVRVINYSETLVQSLVSLEERPTFQAARPRQPRRRLAYLGARINFSEEVKGLLVEEVTEDSPAAKAGLQAGDIVVSIGDKALTTREDLIEALRAGNAGDTVTIKITRDGQEMSVEATYGETPRNP